LPEGVTIRKARDEELETIKRLSVKQTTLELDEYERQERKLTEEDDYKRLEVFFKKEGNEFYVAESEGKMAGYVWFGVSERPFSGLKVGWIYDIEVLPEFRGKGIGEALMKHAMRISKERGYAQMGLMVNEKNKVAWSLYEKLGFETEYRVMSRTEK
jgi:ribosomal protein S18 acetylase RimI-like enzyme